MMICESPKKRRSLFSLAEDQMLKDLVSIYGRDWDKIAKHMNGRNERQCRDRYRTYLSPEIKIGDWTPEEDALIIQKFNEVGKKWVNIAKFFPNRSDTALKNRYNVIKHRETTTSGSSTEKSCPSSPDRVFSSFDFPDLWEDQYIEW